MVPFAAFPTPSTPGNDAAANGLSRMTWPDDPAVITPPPRISGRLWSLSGGIQREKREIASDRGCGVKTAGSGQWREHWFGAEGHVGVTSTVENKTFIHAIRRWFIAASEVSQKSGIYK